MPALLEDEPEFYPALQHIWNWFHQLSNTRGGGFGPAPITFQEIAAWAGLMQTEPTPWEIEQIIRLDAVWFKLQAERDKDKPDKRRGKKGVRNASESN
ncbi:MAG: hypothetical protein A2076_13185 [Geobacteraceae bacterium GWC2_53_11]|nr:MAG: hypothetical protein A2076_13185 [Geobacteraceae bacterium GWC2_53_11]